MAIAHPQFVVGVVSRHRPTSLPPDMLVMTPGVKLIEGADSFGQQYITPEKVHRTDAHIPITCTCSGAHVYILCHVTCMLESVHVWNAYSSLCSPNFNMCSCVYMYVCMSGSIVYIYHVSLASVVSQPSMF